MRKIIKEYIEYDGEIVTETVNAVNKGGTEQKTPKLKEKEKSVEKRYLQDPQKYIRDKTESVANHPHQ